MSDRLPFVAAVTLVFVALWASQLLRTRSPHWQQRQLHRLASRADLAVPAELEPELLRLVTRRQRGWMLGMGLASTLGLAALLVNDELATSSWSFLVMPLSAFVGVISMTVMQLVDRRRRSFGQPVARLERLSPLDLVPPRVVTLVVAITSLSAVLALNNVSTIPSSPLSPALPVTGGLVALGVVSLLLFAPAVRFIAGSRPVAGDTMTLAWSDALRAESARDLLTIPAFAALLAVPVLIADAFWLAEATLAGAAAGPAVGFYATIGLLTVLLVVVLDRRTAQHFRRRLWSAPAPASGMIAS
ncbi:hypothetical protein [Microcella alkalica]|uniref:hypothetical protein n=1 Tax=Microcella alkalica TaxID=355930 RepID=UPI00145F02A8|nr:hypothetical protein [Microcella alkalica]